MENVYWQSWCLKTFFFLLFSLFAVCDQDIHTENSSLCESTYYPAMFECLATRIDLKNRIDLRSYSVTWSQILYTYLTMLGLWTHSKYAKMWFLKPFFFFFWLLPVGVKPMKCYNSVWSKIFARFAIWKDPFSEKSWKKKWTCCGLRLNFIRS